MKLVVGFLSLACVQLVVSAAWAAPLTVKIRSYPCQAPDRAKQGSGVPLGNGWIVTSDHVIFHGGRADGICQEAGGRAAHLMAVHIGKGLALLHQEGTSDAAPRILSQAGADAATTSALTTLAGFPFGSSTELLDGQSQILNAASDRAILPLVPRVIEVRGHNEYGMSGGGLFSEDGRFFGLISHQYLALHLGAPSTAEEYSAGAGSGGEGDMVALAIPAETIRTWLLDVFSKDPARVRLANARLDVKAQLRAQFRPSVNSAYESMVFEGVRFTAQNCTGTGAGIGGDGVGIGGDGLTHGGDGVGIGGDRVVLSVPCQIEITANHDASAWDNVWFLRNAPWFKSLRERVLSGADAEISGLYVRGQRRGLVRLVQLLGAFEEGAQPLLRINATGAVQASSPLENDARQARTLIAAFDSQLIQSGDAVEGDPQAAHRLLSDLDVLLDNLLKTQFQLPERDRLKDLLDSGAWPMLVQLDFDACVRLKSLLLRIEAGI